MERTPAALDFTFGVLASEPRREIVSRLARGAMSTREIAGHFAFSKQALSRHIGLLEDADIIERTVHGRAHALTLAPAPLVGVSDWVGEIRAGWASNFDRLDQILRGADG